jgi:alkylation response protein AidB-like acyl-CoA dehydrogenase
VVHRPPALDLELTDDQQLFRDATVGFIEAELPLAKTRELHDDPRGYRDAWLRTSAAVGWYAMLASEECGGGSVSGHGLADAAIVAELMGCHVQPGPFIPMNVVAGTITRYGTSDQRSTFLPGIVAGDLVVTWAPWTTAGTIDHGAGLQAVRHGDGFLLNGSRGFVQDAQSAQHVLVTATVDGGPAQLLVPLGLAGISIEPLTCLDLSRRAAELTFSDVAVGVDTFVTDVRTAERDQAHVAVALATAETVGALDTMFAMTVSYAKDRVAFGRPIGAFQAIKHILADLALYLEASKAAAVACVRAVDRRGEDIDEVVAMTASYIGEHATEISQQCLQVHGGIGMTWEHDLHLLLRRVQSNVVLYLDPRWHREQLCLAHQLGEPR